MRPNSYGKAKADFYLLLEHFYERTLPPSQVWSDIKWATSMMDFGSMRQRELIKTEKSLAAKIAAPIRLEPNYLRLAQREKIFTVIDGLIERFGQACANVYSVNSPPLQPILTEPLKL